MASAPRPAGTSPPFATSEAISPTAGLHIPGEPVDMILKRKAAEGSTDASISQAAAAAGAEAGDLGSPHLGGMTAGGSPISRNQLEAFTTLVDDVYGAHAAPGSSSGRGGDKHRRARSLWQPFTGRGLFSSITTARAATVNTQDIPAQPRTLTAPSGEPPSPRFQSHNDDFDNRAASTGAAPGIANMGNQAASFHTLGHATAQPAEPSPDAGLAEGPTGRAKSAPTFPSRRFTSVTAATLSYVSSAANLQSPLPQLAALPSLVLPRRWTESTAAIAAAAASAALNAAVPQRLMPLGGAASAPPPEPPAPCRLLELPNELVFLITLACVTPPGGGGPSQADAALRMSPSRQGTAPREAPTSPGWSFALIASPNPSPRRTGVALPWRTSRGGGAVRGNAGGGGGAGEGRDDGMAGLRAVACAAMTCRRLRGAYRLLLAARPDLELQAEAALRSLHQKRRLVRRLTINQHDTYVVRELAAEGAMGVAVAAAVALLCGAFGVCTGPGSGLAAQTLANYAVFTAVHVLLHTAILAAAYRTSAWMGTRRSLALGLVVLVGHYLLLVPAAKVLLGLPRVPPHLNLEPWHRHPAAPPPSYLLAALLWPLYGDGLHWALIHMLSNGFAWVYGAYEWHHSFSRVRLRNGLRY